MTVYLAAAPEKNQTTLSQNLTAVLREIIRSHGDQLERIVYVSDAGKVETAYWRNVLSKFYVNGERILIERTLDYYHVSLRLTTIADCLKLPANAKDQWLKSNRSRLKEEDALEAHWNARRDDVEVDLAKPDVGCNIPSKTIIKFARRNSICQRSLMNYNRTERIQRIAPFRPAKVRIVDTLS